MNALRQVQELSRADFLNSVGLHFLNDRVIMVRLRKRFLSVGVVEIEERALPQGDSRQAISELTGWVAEDIKEIALKAENDARERALRQALVSLLPHFNALQDAVYICLPQEQAIVQQLFFPLAAQDEIDHVIKYELERQLPFKRDELYYDYLPIGKKGEKFCVYVFAIPKRNVDPILTMLESFGIKPVGVETTLTALANYMLFSQGAVGGSSALVAGDGHHWGMIGVEAATGGWKLTPRLLFAHQFPISKWANATGKELLQQYLPTVPNLYRCGDLGGLNGLVDGKLAHAKDIVSLENPRLGGDKSVANIEVLSAIGVALGGLRENSVVANLLRHEGAERQGSKAFRMVNMVLLGLLAIALLGWGISFPVKDELRLRQLQRENQKIEPTVTALRREEEQLQELRKQINYLSDYDRRRGELLAVLDELSKAVPNSAYFASLRYRAGVLEIQGSAENASALIPLLEGSPLFENVAFNAPSNRGRDNRETFSLKAEFEKPKVAVPDNPKAPAKDGVKSSEKATKAKP